MRWARPLLAYVVAAAVTTFPLVLYPASRLGAPTGPGDPFLNLWILGWDLQAVLERPRSILSGQVFNAGIFHPASGALAYSDHLLLQSVALSPVYALTHDVVLCYNLLLLVSLVASALAMHAFVRGVVGSEGGAYVAGLGWGFGSYRFAHLIHLQLQALYFLPLSFLLLHRVVAGARRRDVAALGVVAGLQAVSSVYYGVIGGLALALGGVVLAMGVGRWRSAAVARRLVTSAALAAVLVAPVGLEYWRVAQREGFGRNLFEAGRSAATVSSYLQVPPGNVLYGRHDWLRQHDVTGSTAPPATGPERELFPGFVLVGLALAGVWFGWRGDTRPTVVAALAVAGLGFVLSLGPDGVRTVYAAFHRFVFGFQAIRAPARFSILVTFGLCTLAAIGWRELSSGRRAGPRHRALGVLMPLLMLGAAAEWLHVPVALVAAPPAHTAAGGWLQRVEGPGAVVVLPVDLDIGATPAMVQSLEYRRPIVNGYSGQRPSFYGPLAEAVNAFPAAEALGALRDSGVRFVVTPLPVRQADVADPSVVVERARFPDATIYELHWTPEAVARFTARVAVEPPPVGVIPFRVGEVARYRVRWSGAGVNLSAGDIVARVDPPAYRLVVTATTAPWVAKFFEARDVFATQTDGALLPLVHQREQIEGSRHVVRAFVYDDAARVVRSGRSVDEARAAEAVVLPLLPRARDAIAALFYARTLPMVVGARYQIPVNEAGRNVIVELVVEGHESVRLAGRAVDAWRLTPRLRRPTGVADQTTATVWLGADATRVPLVLDVDAGFGHATVELDEYHEGP